MLAGKFLSLFVSHHMTRITDSVDDTQDLYWLVVILGLLASMIREMYGVRVSISSSMLSYDLLEKHKKSRSVCMRNTFA
jgi:hypothetical protein